MHFPPLLGYPDFPGFEETLQNALVDLKSFEEGVVDAIIIENNYDIPHKTNVDPQVIASLTYLGEKIKNATKLPIGISVLWNDYKTALSISKVLGLRFIRIPVFVDTVETSYGIMEGNPSDVIDFRKSIDAENVAILADIHVKHSKIISKYSIQESTKLAIDKGADALIVTGRWTGEAPEIQKLNEVRKAAGDFSIFCGSGIDKDNIKEAFSIANGAIVSTSVKTGKNNSAEINIKPYSARVDKEKVSELIQSLN